MVSQTSPMATWRLARISETRSTCSLRPRRPRLVQSRRRNSSRCTSQRHHPEVKQIRSSGPLHDFKRPRRLGENRREPQRRCRGVHKEPRTDPGDRREGALLSAREYVLGHQRHVRAWGNRQHRRNSRKCQVPRIHNSPHRKRASTSSCSFPLVLTRFPS